MEYCHDRLLRQARGNLPKRVRRVCSEEDVVQNAFHSFFNALAKGEFPRLENRNDLWKLLKTITIRKARAAVRRANRQKRGEGASARGVGLCTR